jgi:co-chaperonin GroES (HSP10)
MIIKAVGNQITVQLMEQGRTTSGLVFKETSNNSQRLGIGKVVAIGEKVDKEFAESIPVGTIVGFDVYAGQEFSESFIDERLKQELRLMDVRFRIIRPDNIFGIKLSKKEADKFKEKYEVGYIEL